VRETAAGVSEARAIPVIKPKIRGEVPSILHRDE
jgi:hypothetical protein